jgi:hypothetical protein
LIAQFRSNNFALQFFTPEPLLNVTLQAGLSALKTPMCYQPEHRNINCPVCDPDTLGALATDLPLSHHFNSSIVCRISGQIMNEDNLPMALPNGYVYSYNVGALSVCFMCTEFTYAAKHIDCCSFFFSFVLGIDGDVKFEQWQDHLPKDRSNV